MIVATGGLPNLELFEQKSAQAHVVSAWDIISGDVKPVGKVLIYDERGILPVAANAGASVEIMTPDRTFSDVMAINLVPYMRALQERTSPLL